MPISVERLTEMQFDTSEMDSVIEMLKEGRRNGACKFVVAQFQVA